MKSRSVFLAGAALALSAVFGATGALAATNIVQDPSFEDGLGYWTGSGMNQGVFYGGHTDATSNCASAGCASLSGAYLSQNLNTSAGQTYDLQFEVYSDHPPSDNPDYWQFNIYWGGVSLGLTDYTTIGQWTYFTYDNLVAPWNVTSLAFAGRSAVNAIAFDDFSVVETTPGGVPEPATWAMMLLGFLGLGAVLRVHRRADQKLDALRA